MFKNIADAMYELLRKMEFTPENIEHIFSTIAFMNFFQRPAGKEGESIIPNEDGSDLEIAHSTLYNVTQVIKPDYIFFCTKKGFNCFSGYDLKSGNPLQKSHTVGYSSHSVSIAVVECKIKTV